MDLLSALKETGMMHYASSTYYVGWNINNRLCWYKKDTNIFYEYVVPLKVDLYSNYWQPYHKEKPKCKACQEADRDNNLITANHLKKWHCTCGEDK
jgi:hypothetical protein